MVGISLFIALLVYQSSGKTIQEIQDNQKKFNCYGIRLSECPTAYKPVKNDCVNLNISVINIDFSSENQSSRPTEKKKLSKIERLSKYLPIYSGMRGSFFLPGSQFKLNKMLKISPRITIQLWILLIRPGEILRSSENVLEVSSSQENINFNWNENVNQLSMMDSWVNLIWTLEFFNDGNVIFSLFEGELIQRVSSYQKFTEITFSLTLGKLEKASFAGFFYKFVFFNFIHLTQERFEIPICNFSKEWKCESILALEKNIEVIEKEDIEECCQYTKNIRRLENKYCYYYSLGVCKLLGSIKADFITYSSDNNYFVSSKFPQTNGIIFKIWSLNTSDIISSDGIHKLSSNTTFTYGYQRGKFFEYGKQMFDSPPINFYSKFSLIVWFRPEPNSYVFFQKDSFLNISSSEMPYFTDRYKWSSVYIQYDHYVVSKTYTIYLPNNQVSYSYKDEEETLISYYLNGNILNSRVYSANINIETPTSFYLGGNFEGWVYSFKYRVADPSYLDSSQAIQNSCFKIDKMFDAVVCLEECTLNYFYDSYGCFRCDEACKSCHSKKNLCSNCHDLNCSSCDEPFKCLSCSSSFVLNGACFDECPFLTIPSGEKCVENVQEQKFKFTSSPVETNPIQIDFSVQTGPTPVLVENRGFIFGDSTIFNSYQSFYFADDFNLYAMINIHGDGNSSIEVESCFRLDFGPDSSNLTTSSNTSLNIYEERYYPSQWKVYQVFNNLIERLDNTDAELRLDNSYPIPLYETIFKINSATNSITRKSVGWKAKKKTDRFKSGFKISTGEHSFLLIYFMSFSHFKSLLTVQGNKILEVSSLYPISCSPDYFLNPISYECDHCSTVSTYRDKNCNFVLIYQFLGYNYTDCPTFYSKLGKICTQSSLIDLKFKFEVLKTQIWDERSIPFTYLMGVSLSYWPFFSPNYDPIPGKQRGMYFGYSAFNSSLWTSKYLLFAPQLFIGIWIWPESGTFLAKGKIELSVFENSLLVRLGNASDVISLNGSPITVKKWNWVALNIVYNLGQTTLELYTNKNFENLLVFQGTFVDLIAKMIIGAGKNSRYIGWIYELSYSANNKLQTDILMNLGQCSDCNCPSSINTCLNECRPFQYSTYSECKDCYNYESCIGPKSKCFDQNCYSCEKYTSCISSSYNYETKCFETCKTCVASNAFACSECLSTTLRYKDLCLYNCPVLYSKNGSLCTEITKKTTYNFHISAQNVSDTYGLMNFVSNGHLFGFSRGWYSKNLYTQNKFMLPPFFGFTVWFRSNSTEDIIYNRKFDFEIVSVLLSFSSSIINSTLINSKSSKTFYSISRDYWVFIGVEYSQQEASTVLSLYKNGYSEGSSSYSYGYLDVKNESLFNIISQGGIFCIYSFSFYSTFSVTDMNQEIIRIGSCYQPSSFTQCLWNVQSNQFLNNSVVSVCASECTTCRNPYTCTNCVDFYCERCIDFYISSCIKCFDSFLYNGNECYCEFGKGPKGNKCEICPYLCEGCSFAHAFACLSCHPGYFQYSGVCVVLCPILTTASSNLCIDQSQTSISLNFYNFSSIVSDNMNLIILENRTNPARFSYNRGKFFNSLTSQSPLVFSSFMSLETWFRALNTVELFKLNGGLDLNITFESTKYIYLSFKDSDAKVSEVNYSSSLVLNSWNYFLVSFFKSGISTLVCFQENYNSIKFSINLKYFVQSTSSLFTVGGINDMWMYRLTYYRYSKSYDNSNIGSCGGCLCPSELNTCLDRCTNNQFSSACSSCLAECNSCRYNDTCTYCSDRLCLACSDTITQICHNCTLNSIKLSNGSCICAETYFQRNSFCLKCSNLCLSCNDVYAISCLSCIQGSFKYSDVCLSRCPVLTTSHLQDCIDNNINKLEFNFHIEDSVVNDSNDLITFTNKIEPPIFGLNRGKYFSELKSNENLIFSPFFSLALWVKILNPGKILEKVDDFSLSVINSKDLTWKMNITNQPLFILTLSSNFQLNKWKIILIQIFKLQGKTSVEFYESKSNLAFSYSNLNEHFNSSSSKLILGDTSSKSWIYSLKYFNFKLSTLDISQSFGSCLNCDCPSPLTSCLSDCTENQEPLACASCLDSCNSCRYNDTCLFCNQRLCRDCLSFESTECIMCTEHASLLANKTCVCDEGYFSRNSFCLNCYSLCALCNNSDSMSCSKCKTNQGAVMFNQVCLASCPFLTVQNNTECIFSSLLTVEVNFHTFNHTVSDQDNLMSFSNTYNPPLFGYNRGKFIKTYSSNEQFQFSPFFSLILWVRPLGSGVVFEKFSDLSIFLSDSQMLMMNVSISNKTSLTIEVDSSFKVNTWKMLLVVFSKDLLKTTIKFYQDTTTKMMMLSIIGDYFDSSFSNLCLGNTQTYLWVYKIIFSMRIILETDIPTLLGNCSYCTCPRPLNACLSVCSISQEPINCNKCSDTCQSCRYDDTCSQCYQSLCSECLNHDTLECINCAEHAILLSNKTCGCDKGYFQLGSVCKECYFLCEACNDFNPLSCSKCKTNQGALMFNQVCLASCPFLTIQNNTECIFSSLLTVEVNFHTFNQTVSDKNNLMSFSNAQNPPLFGYNRGKFIKTYSSNEQFLFSPYYSLEIWIRPLSPGVLFEKVSDLSIFLSDPQKLILNVSITNNNDLSLVIDSDFQINNWKFFLIVFSKNYKTTTVNFYQDAGAKIFSHSVVEEHFDSISSIISLGNSEGSQWIYKLTYTLKSIRNDEISSLLGKCTDCICPNSVSSCLSVCSLTQQPASCHDCLNSCESCRYNDTCYQCSQRICYECASHDTLECIRCAEHAFLLSNKSCECDKGYFQFNSFCLGCYHLCEACNNLNPMSCSKCISNQGIVMYNLVCLESCPFLTVLNNSDCLASSIQTVDLNFHSLNLTVSDPENLISFSNTQNPPQFGYNRGKFIKTYSSNEQYLFSPFFSLVLWIKPSSSGGIFEKVSDLGIFLSDSQTLDLKIKISSNEQLTLSVDSGFSMNIWKMLLFVISRNGAQSLLKLYQDAGSKVFSFNIDKEHFKSSLSFIVLGNELNSMWIYKIIYTISIIEQFHIKNLLGTCNDCVCPSPLSSCLSSCSLQQQPTNCDPCLNYCISCRYNDTCSLCSQRICENCESHDSLVCLSCTNNSVLLNSGLCICEEGYFQRNSYCLKCFDLCSSCLDSFPMTCDSCFSKKGAVSYKQVCLAACPILTTLNNFSCIDVPYSSYEVNFHSLNETSTNFNNLLTFSNTENPPIFGYNRGKYILSLTSTQPTRLSPFFSMMIWLKPMNSSIFFKKFEDLSLYLNSSEILKLTVSITNKDILEFVVDSKFSRSSWKLLLVVFEKSNSNSLLKVYQNTGMKIFTYTQINEHYNSSYSHIQLGDKDNFMWIYKLILVNSILLITDWLGPCSGCLCPLPMTTCLSECSINEQPDICGSCLESCNSCRYNDTCTNCAQRICEKCSEHDTMECIICTKYASLQSDKSCACDEGYFQKNSICLNCYYLCGVCSDSNPMSCSKCFSKQNAVMFKEVCLSGCPLLTFENNQVCLNSNLNTIHIEFYSLNETVHDNNHLLSFSNPSNPPLFGFNRGKYIKKYTTNEKVRFSPFFSLILWHRPINSGILLEKVSDLSINLVDLNMLQINVSITNKDFLILNIDPNYSKNIWKLLLIVFSKSSKDSIIKIYQDNAIKTFSYTVNQEYFNSSVSELSLGDNSAPVWVYKLSYSNNILTSNDIPSFLGTCSGCICPSPLKVCLSNCPINQQPENCDPCLSLCDSCRYNDSCTNCAQRICESCSNHDLDECLICTKFAVLLSNKSCACDEGYFQRNSFCLECYYYCGVCSDSNPMSCSKCFSQSASKRNAVMYQNVCLEACPLLTFESNQMCLSSSITSIELNFHSLNETISDSNGFISFSNNLQPPLFGYNRGKYISIYETTQQLRFSPFFSLQLWYRPIISCSLIEKLSDLSIYITETQSLNMNISITNKKSVLYIIDSQFSLNAWKLLTLVSSKVSKSNILKIYQDSGSQKVFLTINDEYFNSSVSQLKLGDSKTFLWIYKLTYTNAIIEETLLSLSLGFCSNCICPSPLTVCLSTCELKELPDLCYPCLENCQSCRYNDTCSNCKNRLCLTCSSLEDNKCETCTDQASLTNGNCYCNSHYFARNSFCIECNFYCKECSAEYYKNCTECRVYISGLCVDACPTLFELVGNRCIIKGLDSISLKFERLTGTHLTNLEFLNFSSLSSKDYPNYEPNDPIAEFQRGLYFFASPLISSHHIIFNLNFTISLWIRLKKFGTIIERSRIGFTLLSNGVQLHLIDPDSGNFTHIINRTISTDSWFMLTLMFQSGSKSEINTFFNTLNYKLTDSNKYFIDFYESLVLLPKKSSFEGWVYSFFYSPFILFTIQNIFNQSIYSSLWPCERGEYLNITCLPCKDGCNCRRKNDCTLCLQPLCEICESYSSICTKCFDIAGFRPGTNICTLCNPRCTNCVFSVDSCLNCQNQYLMNHDKTCVKYCADGDVEEHGKCYGRVSKILSFKFDRITNEYQSNNLTLFLGKDSTYYPEYDYLDPKILPLRGLHFNRSVCTLGNFENLTSIRLATIQSFDIYFFALEKSGVLLTMNNLTHSFISCSITEQGKQFTLSVLYILTDFLVEEYLKTSLTLNYNQWIHLSWSINFERTITTVEISSSASLSVKKTAENFVFSQPEELFMQLGNFKRMNYYKGYIYSLAIFNHKLNNFLSGKNCGCHFCTDEEDCLASCDSNEYFSNTCKNCPPECELGCSNNQNCNLHTDPLCLVFEGLNTTCIKCINNTKQEIRPCQCVSGAYYSLNDNSCLCPEGLLIYEDKCDECVRYLKPQDVYSYFSETFLEIFFVFSLPLSPIQCTDIFSAADQKKFGRNFICKLNQNSTILKIELGKGFEITNETIYLNSQNLRANFQECGHKMTELPTKLRYTADIPVPVALIQVFEKIFMKCQDFLADGSLSTGQLLDGLLYKWTLSGDLNKFSRDFSSESQFFIQKKDLIVGNFTLSLTVKNKFNQINSTEVEFEVLATEALDAIFDPLIDFVCIMSQSCIFPIKELITCYPNPVFSFRWEFVRGYQRLTEEKLQYFWSLQTIPTAIQIPENLFKPSILAFKLHLTEISKGISIFKDVVIKIKGDVPNIVISRASGSISSTSDLIIDATLEVDESTQVIYKWSCFFNSAPCWFDFEDSKSLLFVPLNITSLKIFDRFELRVTTTTQTLKRFLQENETLSNTISFSCKFVLWPVPTVKIIEFSSGQQPKIFSYQKITRLVAQVTGITGFKLTWSIEGYDKSIFVNGNQGAQIAINSWMLGKGESYTLKLQVLDSHSRPSEFQYEFKINSPPKLGVFIVSPNSGIELETFFTFSATDWIDEEGNYPLSYSFGFNIRNYSNIIIPKALSCIYNGIRLPYLGNETQLFVRVYDSFEDYFEATEIITMQSKNDLDLQIVSGTLETDLSSVMIQDLPAQLYSKIITVFNRELYINGSFTNPDNSTLETQHLNYKTIADYLELYINSTLESSYLIQTTSGVLLELNQNPYIVNAENNKITLNLASLLLNLSSFSSTIKETSETILSSTSNALYLPSIEGSPNQAKFQEDFLSKLTERVHSSLFPGESFTINSEKMTMIISSLYSEEIDFTLYNQKDLKARAVIPAEYFKFLQNQGIWQVSVSQTFLTIPESSTTMVSVSIFQELSQLKPTLIGSEFEIEIPHNNVSSIKTPVCVFLNSLELWDQTGCSVKQLTDKSIVCGCSHLTFFSGGDLEAGFFPSNNFNETIDLESIKSFTMTSAVGFYYVAILLAFYLVLGSNTIYRDYQDMLRIYSEMERKNLKRFDPETLSIHIEQENLAFELETDQSEKENDSKRNSIKVHLIDILSRMIQKHKFLSIYNKYDPIITRFSRISLIFINLIGKMYFIGLFYTSEKSKDSSLKEVIHNYSARDFLVIFWSNLIVLVIDVIFYKLLKSRPLLSSYSREVLNKEIKYNKTKTVIVMIIYFGVLIYCAWGIIIFATNLEKYISYKWIVSTTGNILFSLFISPFIKSLLVDIILIKILTITKRHIQQKNKRGNKVAHGQDNFDMVAFGDAI